MLQIGELDEITRRYWLGELIQTAIAPNLLFEMMQRSWAKDPDHRYTRRSRAQQHEFGAGDAKAVMRQLRHSKKVSPSLVNRAIKALIQEGYDRGYEDGTADNY